MHSELANTEKKTEHTRMYAQLCSSTTQYSRRLLSILAHHLPQRKAQKPVICQETIAELNVCFSTTRYSKQLAQLCKQEKKCGAHTHARATVQLNKHNIHVGCCLFSHDHQNYPTSILNVVSNIITD